jgi:hypothetical protein
MTETLTSRSLGVVVFWPFIFLDLASSVGLMSLYPT